MCMIMTAKGNVIYTRSPDCPVCDCEPWYLLPRFSHGFLEAAVGTVPQACSGPDAGKGVLHFFAGKVEALLVFPIFCADLVPKVPLLYAVAVHLRDASCSASSDWRSWRSRYCGVIWRRTAHCTRGRWLRLSTSEMSLATVSLWSMRKRSLSTVWTPQTTVNIKSQCKLTREILPLHTGRF